MPLHVTVVLVLCFLRFVLIVYMFACLLLCGKGVVLMRIAQCRTRTALKDPKRLSCQHYNLLLFTSVLTAAGIYELIVYIILIFLVCTYVRLCVVFSHIVVLSRTD